MQFANWTKLRYTGEEMYDELFWELYIKFKLFYFSSYPSIWS